MRFKNPRHNPIDEHQTFDTYALKQLNTDEALKRKLKIFNHLQHNLI